jgi:WD40 repeat protein
MLSYLRLAGGLPFAFVVHVALAFAGVGAMAHSALAEQPAEGAQSLGSQVDRHGDPLPAGASARLGSIRLRPGGGVKYIAFSPDGRRLASWKEDQFGTALSIWDTLTGKETQHTDVPEVHALAFAWLLDGRGIAVLRLGDNTVFIWEFTDGKAASPPVIRQPRFQVRQLNADSEEHGCFAIAPSGAYLAAGRSGYETKKRAVEIWKLATGCRVRDLAPARVLGHQPGNCQAAASTPDSRTLLMFSSSGAADHDTLMTWRLDRADEPRALAVPMTVQQGHVKLFAVAADGRTLALGCPDGRVRCWDLVIGREVRSLPVSLASSGPHAVGVAAVAFMPDGEHLATGGRDFQVRLWYLATGRELKVLPGHHSWVEALAVTTDGKRLASASQDGLIRIADVSTGRDACPVEGSQSWILQLALAPNGKTLASSGRDGALRLWAGDTSRQLRALVLSKMPAGNLAFTPDGKAIAFCREERLALWAVSNGEVTAPPGSCGSQPCRFFRFGAGGKTLVALHGRRVSVWEWPSAREIRTFELPEDSKECAALAVSPAAPLMATMTFQPRAGGTVDLWDVGTGQRLRRLVNSPSPLPDGTFTPDGTGLLLAGQALVLFGPRQSVRLPGALARFDVVTGQRAQDYARPGEEKPGDSRQVRALGIARNGYMLASGEDHGTILVFETASGILRRRLVGHRGGITSLTFLPDGKRLVSSSFDQTGLIWDVSLRALGSEGTQAPSRRWEDLASLEPEIVNRVIADLAANPDAAMGLFKERLRPAAEPGTATLDRLVAKIDSNEFELREQAFKELDRLGRSVASGLRRRLPAATVEVRRRIESLLEKHAVRVSPEELRETRALEILEQIATPAAREVLQAWAGGGAESSLTRGAREALERLTE